MASLSLAASSTSPHTLFTSIRRRHEPLPCSTSRVSMPYMAPKLRLCSDRLVNISPKKSADSVIVNALSTNGMATGGGKVKKQKLQVFNTEEDLASSLAKYTADLSDKFVKEKGSFTIVLSGGSLMDWLRKLTEPPYVKSVDWSKWHVFWLDERVVAKDHKDSNYKLAHDRFLSKVPILPDQVYAINDKFSSKGAAELAAGDYQRRLRNLVKKKVISLSAVSGFPKFDLMLLGMGPDGHIASLFPGHRLLNEKKKWVVSIKDSPKPPPKRITFTFPVINSSSNIALVMFGDVKAKSVEAALGSSSSHMNSTDNKELPVQMVSPEGELSWFLGKGAASKLRN